MKKPIIYNSKNIELLHCFSRIPIKAGGIDKALEILGIKLKEYVTLKKGKVTNITSRNAKELQIYMILPLSTPKETLNEDIFKLIEEYADGVPTTIMLAK